MIILFNKPYNVLCQFTGDHPNLSDYITVEKVYAAGRLDKDSEGLLILTDDGSLQHRISHPRHKLAKTYWVQVEGIPDDTAINKLRTGIDLKDGKTQPARVKRIQTPPVWPRNPPVRFRASIPTSWIELTIKEGRNRQVRRMTAAVGYPTLRLIRCAVGKWHLQDLSHSLEPGEWRKIETQPASQAKHDESSTKDPTDTCHRRRHHRKKRKVSARRRIRS